MQNSENCSNWQTMENSATASPHQSQGRSRTMQGTIWLVIVLDVTGSMQPCIDAVRNALLKMVAILAEGQFLTTLGAILFRDERIGEAPEVHPLGTPPEGVKAVLRDCRASGGGDEPESSLPAIARAVDMLAGAPEGANRMVLHITDAPCHDPEGGNTARSVLDGLKQNHILYFACTPDIEPYRTFANATGGTLFSIASDIREDVFENILLSFAYVSLNTVKASQITVSPEVRKLLNEV